MRGIWRCCFVGGRLMLDFMIEWWGRAREEKRHVYMISGKLFWEDSHRVYWRFYMHFFRGEKVLECYFTSPLGKLSAAHII